MDTILLIRAAALYVPLCATAVAWLACGPNRRERAAALLATAWNVPALLAVHVVAGRLGWWSYGVSDATVAGFPVDLYLGWAVAWGALPSLLGRRLPVGVIAVGAALLDAVAGLARARGWPALTLSTFKDVPFNAPYYARLGFAEVEALTPGMLDIRAEHEARGLDETARVFMRREV